MKPIDREYHYLRAIAEAYTLVTESPHRSHAFELPVKANWGGDWYARRPGSLIDAARKGKEPEKALHILAKEFYRNLIDLCGQAAARCQPELVGGFNPDVPDKLAAARLIKVIVEAAHFYDLYNRGPVAGVAEGVEPKQTKITSSTQWSFANCHCDDLDTAGIIEEARTNIGDRRALLEEPGGHPPVSGVFLPPTPLNTAHFNQVFRRCMHMPHVNNSPRQRQANPELFLADAMDSFLLLQQTLMPSYFRFCNSAAEYIYKDLPEDPRAMFITSFHEDEPNVARVLKELQKQNYDFSKSPFFIFVNGKDQVKINNIRQQIEAFVCSQGAQPPEKQLKLNVISATINQWKFGLKFAPAAVAVAAYAKKGLSLDKKDLPVIAFDCDITKFNDSQAIEKLVVGNEQGFLMQAASFTDNEIDPVIALEENANLYPLVKLLGKHRQLMKGFAKEIRKTKPVIPRVVNRNTEFHAEGILRVLSLRALLTSLGIPPYVHSEDSYSSHLFSSLTKAATSLKRKKDLSKWRIFKKHQGKVLNDCGHLLRCLFRGRPINEMWRSHDGKLGNYPKIDQSQAKKLDCSALSHYINDLAREAEKTICQALKSPDLAAKRKQLLDKYTEQMQATAAKSIAYCKRQACTSDGNEAKLLEVLVVRDTISPGIVATLPKNVS